MLLEEQVLAYLAMLDTQPTYSSATRQAYRYDLLSFLDYLQRMLTYPPLLADFSHSQIEAFLRFEAQNGRQGSTLRRRAASLRHFARYLRQAGLEGPMPARWAVVTPERAPAPRPEALDKAQLRALWEALEASARPRARRDQAILALMVEIGLSAGDLAALNLQDVNLLAGKLRLRRAVRPESWLSLGQAAHSLQRYLREGRPELSKRPDEEALFISQASGRMSRQGIWQAVQQWGSRAGLGKILSPRLARHTAALRLAQAGRPLREIQTLLGHSSPLSTRALIQRLTARQIEAGAERENE